MNTRLSATATRRPMSTFSAMASVIVSAALLAACGGGSGSSGGAAAAGTGPTSSGFSAGTVTGKGSIFVNGVRFDDSRATVLGDDDSEHGRDDVKVGMQVEVEFSAASCSAVDPTGAVAQTCTADRVSFGNNSLLGPVAGFTGTATAPGSFTVLGQKVETDAATTIAFESGVSALADGAIVEVYGSYDKTTGITLATRVEVKAAGFATLPASVRFFRLRGVLDVTAGTIGGVAVDLGGVSTTGLEGQVVRARLAPAAAAPFVVSRLKSGVRKLDDHHGGRAEVEGTIADWAYAADGRSATFTIGGIQVSVTVSSDPASSLTAVLLADLDAALAVLPATPVRVEVHGTVDAAGVLVASRLKLDDDDDHHGSRFEFHGQISQLDVTTRTFALRGETIHITDATEFRRSGRGNGLTEATLANDLKVEVRGKRSTDGTTIVATRIGLDD
ncbi:MAG: hypothetical protein RLZZ584_841 [Pseudomonadota bacterium]|jgi:hypothetical protein